MNHIWILMFYSMPSKPERNRLRIYRRLQKEGTLSLKDGVHLLPYSDDRYELFGWLSGEIKTLGGEMHFVTIDKIEMMDNNDVIALFKKQAEDSYSELEEKIKTFRIENGKEDESRQFLKKISRDFEACYAIDFFHSTKGEKIKKAIQFFHDSLEPVSTDLTILQHKRVDFQGKVWQTRPKPFVDRMASAWLIHRFIDQKARFIFSESINSDDKETVTYDMNDATFTHIGNLCTFEVLIHSFSIDDDRVNHISKIIHNLDIHDDKYNVPEADGIAMILSSIRNTITDDEEILVKSDEIFDYLYKLI